MNSMAVLFKGENVKEHPILFSGPMVRAILEGRKTQTRRVIKPQPEKCPHCPDQGWYSDANFWTGDEEQVQCEFCNTRPSIFAYTHLNPPCPYGQPGDLQWVRETWARGINGPVYRADAGNGDFLDADFRWRPSIHMPHLYSRLTLRITDVRVQRVQEITRADAIAEGIDCDGGGDEHRNSTTLENFARLWGSINAKRGYSWGSNPWVWAISFERG